MIQLHQLEGFYRVARAGGYARAAREFPYPITAPGVHAQVRKLEGGLGVRLFEQVERDRLVPTRAGTQLLSFCAPFFERLPEAVATITRGDRAGRLRVEAGALEIHELLPAWMRRVRARLPDVEIELRETDAPDYHRLQRGELDLIVDYQPRLPDGVHSRVIAVHRAFLVAPSRAGAAATRSARPALAGLADQPFVALEADQPHHALQLDALRQLGAAPRRVTYVPSVTSILAFVAAGLGYSLVPWPHAAGPRIPGVSAVALRGAGTRFPITASFRARRTPDPVLDAVLELARGDARRSALAHTTRR